MAKIKAIVVTPSSNTYDFFVKSNHLDKELYPLVSTKEKLNGYKDTIALCIWRYQDVFGESLEFNHTEALLKNHNVDIIKLP